MNLRTLLEVLRSGTSLSDLSLLSISSQFLSLSLNKILEANIVQQVTFVFRINGLELGTVDMLVNANGTYINKYNHLIFPAVLSMECLILVDSWETEWSSRLSNTACMHTEEETDC